MTCRPASPSPCVRACVRAGGGVLCVGAVATSARERAPPTPLSLSRRRYRQAVCVAALSCWRGAVMQAGHWADIAGGLAAGRVSVGGEVASRCRGAVVLVCTPLLSQPAQQKL
jgi:hypothetical protein